MTIDDLVDDIMNSQAWTRFEEAPIRRMPPEMANAVAKLSFDKVPYKTWVNNLYQVSVYEPERAAEGWPRMIHLTIKRRDKEAVHDWRHFQRIKNELIGPEHEAVELYPAETRLVDSANQYHLFVFAEPGVRMPFGFEERFVSNTSEMGTKQRPFPKSATPADCMTMAQYAEKQGVKL